MPSPQLETAALLEPVRRYVDALQLLLRNLGQTLALKREALEQARSLELQQLGVVEDESVRRLQLLGGERQRILELARSQSLPGDSLENLVRAIGGREREALLARMAEARSQLSTLRRESASHWVSARRGVLQYSELLELIARRGKKPSGYSAREKSLATGGGLLDTTV